MTMFEEAFEYVMNSEDSHKSGVVVNEPPIMGMDPNINSPTYGKEIVVERPKARFGINSHAHPEAAAAGFYEMPHDKALLYAEKTYKFLYWDQLQLDSIPDWAVGAKILDIAINAGVAEAKILLHRAVIAAGSPVMDRNYYDLLIPKLIAAEEEFYKKLMIKNPAKYKFVYAGWIKRADRVPRPLRTSA